VQNPSEGNREADDPVLLTTASAALLMLDAGLLLEFC
jgi:hypothetical protein